MGGQQDGTRQSGGVKGVISIIFSVLASMQVGFEALFVGREAGADTVTIKQMGRFQV